MRRHADSDHDAGRPDDEVLQITDAPVPLDQDQQRRARRYLIQMGIRVACFLGVALIDHWSRWLLLVGAVVLPYVAVVLANAGRERGQASTTLMDARALPSSAGLGPDGGGAHGPTAHDEGAR
ncbi:DUF3099 domain-containing protein [Cellulomonas bogoriensis]|uniref:DUF3099 domain-containing protein n=1 Tax=Cellulomonas bogoriensis TaxID=301388 RepID=UPI000A020A18|nr:DUF3099 domain-containing protein [Cellulomonas bogoriensis]